MSCSCTYKSWCEQSAGLGICSSVFWWANRSFWAKKFGNERFAQKNEQFARTKMPLFAFCILSSISYPFHIWFTVWFTFSFGLPCQEVMGGGGGGLGGRGENWGGGGGYKDASICLLSSSLWPDCSSGAGDISSQPGSMECHTVQCTEQKYYYYLLPTVHLIIWECTI